MNIIIENTQNFLTLPTDDYNDLLDRRKIAKNFLEVVKVQTANVYSINAPWGSGKTWFLKFIEDECKNQNIPFIQFNVWETDYAKDPFQAVLSELLELLQQQIKLCAKEDVVKEFQSELALLERNAEDFLNLRKRMSFSIGLGTPFSPISAQATLNPDNSSLAEYNEMKKVKYGFISNLRNFVNKFDMQLIIAIDELDRCRPDYAISTLEIIKHFFNIEGIKFILAIDKEQLNRTIYTMYGNMPDTDAYLSKFVDIQYTLSNTVKNEYIKKLFENKYSNIRQNLNKLGNESRILIKYNDEDYTGWALYRYEEDENEDILKFISLCEFYNLSLREIDKLCLKFSIILTILIDNSYILQMDFLLQLIMLNIKNVNIYSKLKKIVNIPFVNGMIDNSFKINSTFEEVYKFLVNIKNNPKDSYYFANESLNLYKSHKSLRKYFDIIDFAEGFS